jgi:peptidoglycan hydrolase CwlO-like protein
MATMPQPERTQLDEILTKLGALTADMSGVKRTVARIDDKLDTMAERMVKVEERSADHEKRIQAGEEVNERVEKYEQRAVGGALLVTLAAGGIGAMAWSKMREWFGI